MEEYIPAIIISGIAAQISALALGAGFSEWILYDRQEEIVSNGFLW